MPTAKKGLYANIQAKRERIAHGSGETMRKAGSEGAPVDGAFAKAAETTKSAKTARRSAAAKKSAKKVARKAAKKTPSRKTARKS